MGAPQIIVIVWFIFITIANTLLLGMAVSDNDSDQGFSSIFRMVTVGIMALVLWWGGFWS